MYLSKLTIKQQKFADEYIISGIKIKFYGCQKMPSFGEFCDG